MTVAHFRKLVSDETERLNSLCNRWNTLAAENENIPEKVIGDISVSTGKAQLLIRERFNQFNKLIFDCENKCSEKEIRLDDLQGFWEMIYYQVEEVVASFEALETIRLNDWKEIEPIPVKIQETKPKPSKPAVRKLPNYSNVKSTFRRPKTQLKPVNM